MDKNYLEQYSQIVAGYNKASIKLASPDEQGRALKKCSILTPTKVRYSDATELDTKPDEMT